MKSLGKAPSAAQASEFAALPNYTAGKFQNLGGVKFSPSDAPVGKLLRGFLSRPKTTRPSRPMPSVTTDLRAPGTDRPTIIWFGHSSYLIKYEQLNIMVDPVFSGNASPVPGSVRAFTGSNEYGVADLPPIDVLVLTHDHYDHLDYATVAALRPQVGRVVTALGVGAHLRAWGYDAAQITELNWHETTAPLPGVQFTAVPAQHMSGRTFSPQNTLWAAFVLQLGPYRLYLGGDSGYGPHFKETGVKYGPFDLALLENGQYNELWHAIHTLPEETAQAAHDLRAATLLPVHWAKFVLGYHPWNEPVQRLLPAAAALGQPVTVPRIGEPYTVGDPVRAEPWWEFEKF